MIGSLGRAVEDRIKNPIIGTFSIFFLYFNLAKFHKILAALKGVSLSDDFITSIEFEFSSPLKYMLMYIAATSIVKIFNKWWNEVVDTIAESFADKAKGITFTENLKKNNDLARRNKKLNQNISKAITNLNSMNSHIESLTMNGENPKNRATHFGHIKNYRDKVLFELQENSQ